MISGILHINSSTHQINHMGPEESPRDSMISGISHIKSSTAPNHLWSNFVRAPLIPSFTSEINAAFFPRVVRGDNHAAFRLAPADAQSRSHALHFSHRRTGLLCLPCVTSFTSPSAVALHAPSDAATERHGQRLSTPWM
jgi:hypothetical protein